MTLAGNHRQTISFLTRRFRDVGIEPNPKKGQNFLIDLNLLRLLSERAEIGPRDLILEVGTGAGSLTGLMAPAAAHVITVEVDPRLYQLASEELIDHDNVTLLHLDALKNKNHIEPRVLEEIDRRLAEDEDRRFKLTANLPYCIATPIISNLLRLDRPPTSMTVTIQKELADRIVARPSTKDYGALSIWMQSQCQTEIVRILPPSTFWPRPKVHSAIIHIDLLPDARAAIGNLDFFHGFTRAMFLHRRKFMRSVLASALKGRMTKSDADDVMRGLDLGPETRAEQLDPAAMLRLCDAVRLRFGDEPLL